MPMTIRSLFHPLLGDRVDGPIGHAIDIVAVVATMFGIVTSLGLGVTQVAAGIGHVFDWEPGNGGMVLIIAVITALATISVVLGLDKGIKILSQINIAAAGLLAAAVLLVGPTLFLIFAFVDNTGSYLQNMIDTLLFTGAYDGEGRDFLDDWTIFYWAWWISWSPFVGMFIARVSYGRTIRQFVTRRAARPHARVLRVVHDLRQHRAGDRRRGRRGERGRRGRRDVRPAREPRHPRRAGHGPVGPHDLRRRGVLRHQLRLRVLRHRHAHQRR
jgi:choline-glycine betaine transporter